MRGTIVGAPTAGFTDLYSTKHVLGFLRHRLDSLPPITICGRNDRNRSLQLGEYKLEFSDELNTLVLSIKTKRGWQEYCLIDSLDDRQWMESTSLKLLFKNKKTGGELIVTIG